MTKRLCRVLKLPAFVNCRELEKYVFVEIPVKAEADDSARRNLACCPVSVVASPTASRCGKAGVWGSRTARG
jgi:hypothetical protein